MNGTRGARYLPLAAIVAIQLLIVAVAPSVQEQTVATGAPADATFGGTAGIGDGTFQDPAQGQVVDDTSGGGIAIGDSAGGVPGTGTGTTDPGAGTGGGTATTVAGGGPSTTVALSGDTSHCVGDRQFDPAIDFYAPPCVPAADGTNPGATYQGVTGEEILVIRYYDKGDPAVNAVLDAQGSFVEADQYRAYNEKLETFIEQHYELYGRKVRIEVFEGTCNSIPPDISCLTNEFRELVAAKKPFAVIWRTSLCSQCYTELSKLKTVNLGGYHFLDSYSQRWRPYHYGVTASGTRLAQHAGRMWCNQLAGRNAEYARENRYKGMQRALGVIATNDPQNQALVEVDLKAELAKCGESFENRTYFYEQDITTADTQRRAGVLAMRGNAIDPNDDATSVMCFCDSVAPAFLYQEQDVQQYYPENIVTGTGFMDLDGAGQAFVGTVGCPQGGRCAFEGAFGFSTAYEEDPIFGGRGTRVWRQAGGQGDPPFEFVDQEWDYYNLLFSGIQMAGPNLNPETLEQGMFRLGARGDNDHPLRQISPGNYYWAQDVQRVYWSNTKTSPYNGEQGTYVALEPTRIRVDQWKQERLVLPGMPR